MRLRHFIVLLSFLFYPAVGAAQVLTGYFPENNPVLTEKADPPAPGHFIPKLATPSMDAPKEIKQKSSGQNEPVDLDADSLSHDEQNQILTASGDVFLKQSGRILRADQITYNLATDRVEASGDVVINEVNGDIHYAERVELTDKMKDGFVDKIQTTTNDGSRFKAKEGKRTDGTKTTMYDAYYTPCAPCKKNPEADPPWQLRASEVTQDDENHRVVYKNARFEVYGVPVMYTPYFSHPDGSIKRKSGFLAPAAGYKSNLGAFLENSYYMNIAPDKDATAGLMVMTDKNPLATLEYRQRWENAMLNIRGGGTYSDRPGIDKGDELRGHIFTDALWDINDKWRAGIDSEWTSDDQYMRQFDFSNEDVLESQIYAERFSGRDYTSARLISFQDTRVRDEQFNQPEVLPEITANFIGEPGSIPLLKGRWGFEGSFLGLQRDNNGQDMNRLSGTAEWARRLVSRYGLVTDTQAQARWDMYSTRDRDASTEGSGIGNNATDTRFFPNFHVQSSYPLAKQFETTQMRIEPIAALTIAQNIDVNDDIPNEDSQDVQLDASNLFEPNRFPGYDRIEDKSHLTYGVNTGLYGDKGSYGQIFIGQSYRFDDDDNPFSVGSGLNEQKSDIVGQITGQYDDQYTLNYRFQLDSESYASQRHELDAYADWNRFRLSSRYLYASALEGTDISENREQLSGDALYYFTKEWRVRGGAVRDFGTEDDGIRQAYGALDYLGQCVFWSLTGNKNYTDEDSGESDTEFLFRIGLKNLGDFETSDLRVEDPMTYRE